MDERGNKYAWKFKVIDTHFKILDTHGNSSAIFHKGNDFCIVLFAFPYTNPFQKRGLSY